MRGWFIEKQIKIKKFYSFLKRSKINENLIKGRE